MPNFYKSFKQISIFNIGIFSVFAGLSFTTQAITPDPSQQNIYQREFNTLDTDRNGQLTSAEIKRDKCFSQERVSNADKNRNGQLSQDEYANYKSAIQQKETKQAAVDSAITTKIKSKYLIEKNFSSLKVSVETKDNIVLLSGFVDSAQQKSRAETIAKSVSGVKSIKNALVIKP